MVVVLVVMVMVAVVAVGMVPARPFTRFGVATHRYSGARVATFIHLIAHEGRAPS